jgi:hypothetical protein
MGDGLSDGLLEGRRSKDFTRMFLPERLCNSFFNANGPHCRVMAALY